MGKKLNTLGLIVLTAAAATSAAYSIHEISRSRKFKEAVYQLKQYFNPANDVYLK